MTNKSVWSDSTEGMLPAPRPMLEGDIKTDVLIIGAGLAGILTAHQLTLSGIKCVVVDARRLGGGVTKNTTAKITAQHGLIYERLIDKLGFENTKLYLDANLRAIAEFRALAQKHPCDFEEKTAYIYTEKDRPRLEREASAYRTLGVAARIADGLPLPVKTEGALAIAGQAQFNPLKLLYSLSGGLEIYENTYVRRIKRDTAITPGGKISAGCIILATHFPLINIPGLYFMKLYGRRSCVAAFEGASIPEGMFAGENQDDFSFQTYKNLTLIGIGERKGARRGDGLADVRNLASLAYPRATEKFSWSAQECMTFDGLPYIGRLHKSGANLYLATGFNKWGMTGSMTSSIVLRDLIVSGNSELEKLLSPQRKMLIF